MCLGDGHLGCVMDGSITMHPTAQPAGGHPQHQGHFSVFNPPPPAMLRWGEIHPSPADSVFLAAGA